MRIQRPNMGNRPRRAAQRPPATNSSRCRAQTGQASTGGCMGSAQVERALLEQWSTWQFPAAFDGGLPAVCGAGFIMPATLLAIPLTPVTTGQCMTFRWREQNRQAGVSEKSVARIDEPARPTAPGKFRYGRKSAHRSPQGVAILPSSKGQGRMLGISSITRGMTSTMSRLFYCGVATFTMEIRAAGGQPVQLAPPGPGVTGRSRQATVF
jgi:hypothetical protein